jgi:hypothetical protein
MLSGAADELETAPLIGVAAAVKVTSPRLDGLHEQVAVKVEPDPMAAIRLTIEANNNTPPANPSSPSIKLTALTIPTIHKTVIGNPNHPS